MYTKTITYVDFNGTERTEDFLFNFTETELMQMELTTDGGFIAMLEKIVAAKEQTQLVELFTSMIAKSYGEKSDDGRRFMKSEKRTEEFMQTEAYNKLYMELITNAESAAEFVIGIMPSKVQKEAREQFGENPIQALMDKQ